MPEGLIAQDLDRGRASVPPELAEQVRPCKLCGRPILVRFVVSKDRKRPSKRVALDLLTAGVRIRRDGLVDTTGEATFCDHRMVCPKLPGGLGYRLPLQDPEIDWERIAIEVLEVSGVVETLQGKREQAKVVAVLKQYIGERPIVDPELLAG